MAVQYAHINPDNISWARERAQLSVAVLAEKLKIQEEKLLDWESGKRKITFIQAQNIAKKTFIPFGYLFLNQVHADRLPIPDLRTLESQALHQPSAELLLMIKTINERQQWYKNYLRSQGIEKNAAIGHFSLTSSVDEIVRHMRNALELPLYPKRGNWEDYLRLLIHQIEKIGILVMRHADLGHHTRSLSVEEFRGFALFDTLAPVIFINQADVPSARLFTLIHELAHIWIGESGISDGSTITEQKEEVLCNAVAAEFLVPSDEFEENWIKQTQWEDNLPHLVSHFRVSTWVLARKALTLDLITQQQYVRYISKLKQQHINKRKQSSGGPTYYQTRKSQLSEQFSRALLSETLSGRVLLRDAGHLLGIKPHNIQTFAKEFGI